MLRVYDDIFTRWSSLTYIKASSASSSVIHCLIGYTLHPEMPGIFVSCVYVCVKHYLKAPEQDFSTARASFCPLHVLGLQVRHTRFSLRQSILAGKIVSGVSITPAVALAADSDKTFSCRRPSVCGRPIKGLLPSIRRLALKQLVTLWLPPKTVLPENQVNEIVSFSRIVFLEEYSRLLRFVISSSSFVYTRDKDLPLSSTLTLSRLLYCLSPLIPSFSLTLFLTLWCSG